MRVSKNNASIERERQRERIIIMPLSHVAKTNSQIKFNVHAKAKWPSSPGKINVRRGK